MLIKSLQDWMNGLQSGTPWMTQKHNRPTWGDPNFTNIRCEKRWEATTGRKQTNKKQTEKQQSGSQNQNPEADVGALDPSA